MTIQTKNRIAILNGMADSDFERSLDLQKSWGIIDLDLKDSIFGKSLIELTDEEALRACAMIQERGLRTYCLSTNLFHDDLLKGEAKFGDDNLSKVPKIIALAKLLKPRFVRLLPARLVQRAEIIDSIAWTKKNAPWMFNQYQQAISLIHQAGFEATIENEVYGCIFGNPGEILEFFDTLGNDSKASFTWDIQNLWQSGTFPSLDLYRQLKPLINYVHVKGGIKKPDTGELAWASSLEEASWPVKEIIREVVRDSLSDVICINPSHGAWRPGFNIQKVTRQDVSLLSSLIDR
jgi:sugar phosphate isomerase/epimerase